MPLITQALAYVGDQLVAGGVVQPRPSLLPVSVSATTGGTAHTAGTPVEVTSSLPAAAQWLFVDLASSNAGNGVDTSTLIEIRTGADLSTVLLTIAAGYRLPATESWSTVFSAPCAIAAGTRVGVAVRSARTSQALTVIVSTGTLTAPVSAPVAFGVDTATSKSSLALADPAGTGTPGAWTEVTASTSTAWQGVHLGPQMNASTNVSTGTVDIDVGIGGAGSEVVVGTMRCSYNSNERMGTLTRPFLPALIPAGTRVAVRMAQRTAATMPCDVIVHGIPLGG